jgi:Domain of unknown function (DUF6966)
MPEPTSKNPDQLARAIDEITALLRRFGEQNWSERLSYDANLIRAGDFYGVERFLSAFGGMGSLNDLVISTSNHHAIPASWESDVNSTLAALVSRAYAIAIELARVERQHGA